MSCGGFPHSCSFNSRTAAMPPGDLVRPCLMSLTAWGDRPMALPMPVSDQPCFSRSVIADAQFMDGNLRYSVIPCQRHSVTERRSNLLMTTIGDRVKAERKGKKWARKRLAQLTGLSETAISDLELGYSKRSLSLHKLADALQVNVHWLETGKGPRQATDTDDGMVLIRRWHQPLAAGDGSAPVEFVEADGLKFKARSLHRKGLNPDNLAVLDATGDSMEPRIHNGDVLLIDCGETIPQPGRIYALEYDGNLYVKRLENFGTAQWFMVSDNSHDPKWRKPKPIEPHGHFKPIGRVRWIGSWEDP